MNLFHVRVKKYRLSRPEMQHNIEIVLNAHRACRESPILGAAVKSQLRQAAGEPMIFYITFEYDPRLRDAVHERFKQTGAPPPEGVTMIGRWHSTAGNRGVLIAESSQADSITRWLQEWTELINFKVTPVLTDEQFLDVLT